MRVGLDLVRGGFEIKKWQLLYNQIATRDLLTMEPPRLEPFADTILFFFSKIHPQNDNYSNCL